MKKIDSGKALWVTFWVVMALVIGIYLAYAGERYRISTNAKGSNASQVIWRIRGTGADTSQTYMTQPVMTIHTWAADTTIQDSVALTLTLQTQGAQGWYTFKTTTITAESTDAAWMITDSAVPSGTLYRLVVTGGAANSKGTDASVQRTIGKFTFDSGN